MNRPSKIIKHLLTQVCILCSLCACQRHRFVPPFNNFQTNYKATVYHRQHRGQLIKQLQKQDIELVTYGDTMTLIVPTDKYFIFNSPRLNEDCYQGLLNIIRLLKQCPCSMIYVAGFTDNVGSARHKKRMSRAQAETMLSFLWANDIRSSRLKAEGYGDKNDIGSNALIHGSAFNRRIEIQWVPMSCKSPPVTLMTK